MRLTIKNRIRAGILCAALFFSMATEVDPAMAQAPDSAAAIPAQSVPSPEDGQADTLETPPAGEGKNDSLPLSRPESPAPGDSAVSAPDGSVTSGTDSSAAPKAAVSVDSTVQKKRPVKKTPPPPPPPVTPPPVSPRALRYNAIYLNSGSVANGALMDKFIQRVRGTAINGFVMDMKDDMGRLSWRSRLPLAALCGSNTRRVSDPTALVKKLHDNGLVACARVVSFKDPLLASYPGPDSAYPYAVLNSASGRPWEQDNGELWINPYDSRVQEYLIGVVEELLSFGFDQVQMDYIRFPTDGKIGHLKYPVVIDSLEKIEVISGFLSRIRQAVDKHDASLSVDVFGWVPWLRKGREFNIGQDYDAIARHADVVCPMLYDSHFPKSFKSEYGRDRAYHIVREGTAKGVERSGKRLTGVQPYIQGFNWRSPHWGTRYIIQQMQAAEDSGAVGWIVWNARNDYSETWKALAERQSRTSTGAE